MKPLSIDEIVKRIQEARAEAFKNEIEANTIIISERLAKTKPFIMRSNNSLISVPPMILGMEMKISNELPLPYDFAILHVAETERESIKRKKIKALQTKLTNEINKLIEEYIGEWIDE